MRYPAAEKLEDIRLVEGSHLPVRRTLAHLGIPPATLYRWYERYRAGGPEALEDRPSRPDRVWNRIPDAVRGRILDLALAEPELSPRELAVRFTDRERYFVSEASVYRLLAAHDLHPRTCFTTRDGFTTYNMVGAGLGVSFNQRLISRRWNGTVTEVPFDPPQFVTLGISVPSLKEASPAARKFIDCAIETVSAEEHLKDR